MKLNQAGVVVLSAALMLTGCSTAGAESCEEIADDMVTVANDYAAKVDQALEDGPNGATPSVERGNFQAETEAISQRVKKAGCTEKMGALMQERADQIEGEGFSAKLMRQLFQQGGELDLTS